MDSGLPLTAHLPPSAPEGDEVGRGDRDVTTLELGSTWAACLCPGTISPLLRWEVGTRRGTVARKQRPVFESQCVLVRQHQEEGPEFPLGSPACPGSQEELIVKFSGIL